MQLQHLEEKGFAHTAARPNPLQLDPVERQAQLCNSSREKREIDGLKINGIIWLDEIIEKLVRKHNVRPGDVTEILSGKPRFRFVEKGHRPEENVYSAMGTAGGGRYPIVFFVYKPHGEALILSARDMTKAERRRYEQA
ncbi:MAG: hypothetical protein ABIJ56_03745 [Pseudomonadota bacterium]